MSHEGFVIDDQNTHAFHSYSLGGGSRLSDQTKVAQGVDFRRQTLCRPAATISLLVLSGRRDSTVFGASVVSGLAFRLEPADLRPAG
ncbi:hypothetical protein GCM10023346_26170 [Arthrobacter gyeryongensis]|uniref:Uncharacterized protein n=1 Tax=Arthrobacter gyeryongensis TaxID=1650592 RepID=A0ABP9SIJ8_9MICC